MSKEHVLLYETKIYILINFDTYRNKVNTYLRIEKKSTKTSYFTKFQIRIRKKRSASI